MNPSMGATITVALPPSAADVGRVLYIKNVGAGMVAVLPPGEPIDGMAILSLAPEEAVELVAGDIMSWDILGHNP